MPAQNHAKKHRVCTAYFIIEPDPNEIKGMTMMGGYPATFSE